MNRLKDKCAIITGAAGGIGAAIAETFAKEGASVLCVDIDRDALTETVAAISEAGSEAGGRAKSLVADVAEESTAIDAVAQAKDTFGRLDILVSNAVTDLPYMPLTEISIEDWRRTMDVNLNAAFLLSKHAIPVMAAGGGGNIILVASQLGQVARPGRPWYCAQKGGLINMAKAMALDHAKQNIRVNSLSPGPVETGRYISNFKDAEEARKNNFTLFERLGQPSEIAWGAVFLASDEASFMTGADLLIDGGYTAV